MSDEEQASAEAMANAVASDRQLKDRFDKDLVKRYVQETLEYDRNAAGLKQASQDNKAGRRSCKKKFESEGVDTDAVDKVLKAYRIIRTSGVPDDKLTGVFKSVEVGLGGSIISDDDQDEGQND